MRKDNEQIYHFSGKVISTVWDKSDFKVYALEIDKKKYPDVKYNKYGNVTIIGDLPKLSQEVTYEITAIEKQQAKYGISYQVINIKRDKPKTVSDVHIFLSEILTQSQADTLCEHYPDIIDRIKNGQTNDIDFKKIKGIKEKTFAKIKNTIIENFCLMDLVIEFQGLISMSVLKKIYDRYSSLELLKEKLKSEPYKCLCSLGGIGFKKADSILLELDNVSKERISKGQSPIIDFDFDLKSSPQRCLAFMLYALYENESSGNTCMNIVELRSQCINIVPECANHFTDCIKNKSIYYNKENLLVALKTTYNIELYIANTIYCNILGTDNKWDYDIEKYRVLDDNSVLTDEQINVLNNLCKYNVSILNGFAGSGKSLVTKAIIKMLQDKGKTFRLLAPTGKAAKVLAEYTNQPTSTIHRGLGYQPPNSYKYDEFLKLDYDVIIIDETSMVGIELFYHLIKAVDFSKTKLLMIGDQFQLPSVSCGNLLNDFIESNIIPCTTLTKIFRYSEGGLMTVATDTRHCKPFLNSTMTSKATYFGTNKDYCFVDIDDSNLSKSVVALYKKLILSGYTINDIQVLTAKNVGDCGTVELNNLIQRVINKNYGKGRCITFGETSYYKDDIVIQKANNYKAKIYRNEDEETAFIANGETGLIKSVIENYLIIDFDGILIQYEKGDLINLSLGYAISIHKSQGSSVKIPIICSPKSHIFMSNSNLLYVALTRTKEKCYHLGTLKSVNQAIYKKANLERKTFMLDMLVNNIKYKTKENTVC